MGSMTVYMSNGIRNYQISVPELSGYGDMINIKLGRFVVKHLQVSNFQQEWQIKYVHLVSAKITRISTKKKAT